MIATEVVFIPFARGFSASRLADMTGGSFFGFRTSQGGITCGTSHKPRLASRSPCSKSRNLHLSADLGHTSCTPWPPYTSGRDVLRKRGRATRDKRSTCPNESNTPGTGNTSLARLIRLNFKRFPPTVLPQAVPFSLDVQPQASPLQAWLPDVSRKAHRLSSRHGLCIALLLPHVRLV